MTAVILTPRRSDGGHRDRLWSFVRPHLEAAGFPVVEGHHDDGPFNRSAAINRAARDAGDWDVAIITDADTLVSVRQLHAAARLAHDGIAFSYRQLHCLTRSGTERVLDGFHGSWSPLIRWTLPEPPSSSLAVTRRTWETVGGFDERFRGWGWEDVAFSLACLALAGRYERIDGAAWHLWHPRATSKATKDADYRAAQKLGDRYKAAKRDPDAMRALIAER